MDFFNYFTGMIAEALPEFLLLLLCPALLVVAGILLVVFRCKKAYVPVAIALGGAACVLVGCKYRQEGTALDLVIYLGLYAVLASVIYLFFLLPSRAKKGSEERAKEMYEKFRAPLEEPVDEAPDFEDGETYDAAESGLRLAHANVLLQRLKGSDLSASDRLEVDAVSHTIASFGQKELTADEMRSLNDCLATVLKLTAKYRL